MKNDIIMELSICQIIGFAIILVFIGVFLHYLFTKKKWNDLFKRLLDNIIIYWYLIVFFVTTWFVVANYDECIDLHGKFRGFGPLATAKS